MPRCSDLASHWPARSLVADQIASGVLVCPLKLAAPTAYSYYLLGLPEAVDRPKIADVPQTAGRRSGVTEASTLSIDQPVLRPIGAFGAIAAAA